MGNRYKFTFELFDNEAKAKEFRDKVFNKLNYYARKNHKPVCTTHSTGKFIVWYPHK